MHHEPCAQLYNLWYQCVILNYGPKAICIRETFPLFQGRKRKKGLLKSNMPWEVLWNRTNKQALSLIVLLCSSQLSHWAALQLWKVKQRSTLGTAAHLFCHLTDHTTHPLAIYMAESTMNRPVQCHLRLPWAPEGPCFLCSLVFSCPLTKRLGVLCLSIHLSISSLLSPAVLLCHGVCCLFWAASTPLPQNREWCQSCRSLSTLPHCILLLIPEGTILSMLSMLLVYLGHSTHLDQDGSSWNHLGRGSESWLDKPGGDTRGNWWFDTLCPPAHRNITQNAQK